MAVFWGAYSRVWAYILGSIYTVVTKTSLFPVNLSDFSVTWAYTRVVLVRGDLGGLIRGGGAYSRSSTVFETKFTVIHSRNIGIISA